MTICAGCFDDRSTVVTVYDADAGELEFCRDCWPMMKERVMLKIERDRRIGHTGSDMCGCERAQRADIVLRPQYSGDYSIAKLIGQKLRDLRLADNQTQGEAADKAGVTVAQWSAAENGRYILAALAILDRYT